MLSQHHAWLLGDGFEKEASEKRELDLSRCTLITENPAFPKLSRLPKLVSLVLNKCEIKSIDLCCDILGLQFLGVAHNKIAVLPDKKRLSKLGKLVAIDLADNKLSSLDELNKLSAVTNLKALQVTGNFFPNGWLSKAQIFMSQIKDWGDIPEAEKIPSNEKTSEIDTGSPESQSRSISRESQEMEIPNISEIITVPLPEMKAEAAPRRRSPTSSIASSSRPESKEEISREFPGHQEEMQFYRQACEDLELLLQDTQDLEICCQKEDDIWPSGEEISTHFQSVSETSERTQPPPKPLEDPDRSRNLEIPTKMEISGDLVDKLFDELLKTEQSLARNLEISHRAARSLNKARKGYLAFLASVQQSNGSGNFKRLAVLLIARESALDAQLNSAEKFTVNNWSQGDEDELQTLEVTLMASKPGNRKLAELRSYTELCHKFADRFEKHAKFVDDLSNRKFKLGLKLKHVKQFLIDQANSQKLASSEISKSHGIFSSLETAGSALQKYLGNLEISSGQDQSLIQRLKDQHEVIEKLVNALRETSSGEENSRVSMSLVDGLLKDREMLMCTLLENEARYPKGSPGDSEDFMSIKSETPSPVKRRSPQNLPIAVTRSLPELKPLPRPPLRVEVSEKPGNFFSNTQTPIRRVGGSQAGTPGKPPVQEISRFRRVSQSSPSSARILKSNRVENSRSPKSIREELMDLYKRRSLPQESPRFDSFYGVKHGNISGNFISTTLKEPVTPMEKQTPNKLSTPTRNIFRQPRK